MKRSSTIRISRRVLMRYLRQSASEVPGAVPRNVHRNLEESGSPATFQDNKPKRKQEFEEESIYEVSDADDKLKISPGGTPADTRDWTHLQPQYLKPSVPDNVRR